MNSLIYSLFIYVLFIKDVYVFEIVTIPVVHSRATTFTPHVIDKTCALKYDAGPCRAGIEMYYFNVDKMNCSTFQWGGCQGNGNRFDSHWQCITACTSQPNPTKHRPKWCSLSFDYGYCFGAIDRWYYDPLWRTCKKTIYSGCGGNKNNFYTQDQCDGVCRFGNGWVTPSVRNKHGLKKVLIVNPSNMNNTRKGQVVPNKGGGEKDGKGGKNGNIGRDGKDRRDGNGGTDISANKQR